MADQSATFERPASPTEPAPSAGPVSSDARGIAGESAPRGDGPSGSGRETTASPTEAAATVRTDAGVAPQRNALSPAAHATAVATSRGGSAPLTGEVLAPSRKKRRIVLPLILVGLIGGGAWAGYQYFTEWRFIVSTDDAYVKADVSIMAAKVSGYIEAVPVVENTKVKAGDLLAKIDDGDYRIAVRSATDKIATQDATIERLGRQAAAQKAAIDQALAQVAMAQADALRASLAYDRALALSQNQYTTKANLDQTRADKDRTAANVFGAKAAMETARANLSVALAQQVEARQTRAELQSSLAQAQRDLRFTAIRAPFDGVVGNKAAQPGQYVTPGTRLMALVPLQSAYVEANFKETQLGTILPGQAVEITVDAYSGRTIRGTVESFSPASGQQFSLLPPENATGNFTKIVQRVPVRIKVPAGVAAEGILRPGLSVVASVHTRDERLPKPTLVGLLGLPDLFAARSPAAVAPPTDVRAASHAAANGWMARR